MTATPEAPATPSRFASRWAAMTQAEKVDLAGDAAVVKELDRLATGKKVDANPEETLEELRRDLRDIATRLNALKITTDDLYAQRRLVFLRLLLRGEQIAAIAREAEVRPMIINYATGISKKTR